DGRLGRKLSTGEPVNVDLPAIGTGRWAGKRLQFRLEFVGIVGQRVQVLTADDHRACVVVRIYADLGGFAFHYNFFFLRGNLQRKIDNLLLAGDNLYHRSQRPKAFGAYVHAVFAGRQISDVKAARAVGLGGNREAARVLQGDRRPGNHSAGRIGNLATEPCCCLLRRQRAGEGQQEQKGE